LTYARDPLADGSGSLGGASGSGAHAAMPSGGALAAPPAPPSSSSIQKYVGQTIDGRYRLERVLGEGGMGVVYLGHHLLLSKVVAIKVLRSDLARDKELVTRFLNEAQAASRIGNPHIVDISDFGMLPEGGAYFAMEHLAGQSLGDMLDRHSTLPLRMIAHIAKQVAEALGAAHAAGIVHRDLKPDNIMLVDRGGDPHFVKILDFGIAKVANTAHTKLTRAGSVFGTPQYMSPEQAGGLSVDHRSDIYALGVLMYEMCKGTPPFGGDNVMNILSHHMFHPPPPMREARGDIPDAFEAVVLKCLAKKPEARYASMHDLIADLTAVESGLPSVAAHELLLDRQRFSASPDVPRAVTATVRTLPRIRDGKGAWVAGAVALTLLSALAVGLVVTKVRDRDKVAAVLSASTAPSAGPVQVLSPPPSVASVASAAPIASSSASLQPAAVARVVRIHVEPEHATAVGVSGPGASSVAPGAREFSVRPDERLTVRFEYKGFGSQTVELTSDSPASMNLKLTKSGALPAMPATTLAPRPSSAPATSTTAAPVLPTVPAERLSSPPPGARGPAVNGGCQRHEHKVGQWCYPNPY
jgi:serine/threonine-protein kinase